MKVFILSSLIPFWGFSSLYLCIDLNCWPIFFSSFLKALFNIFLLGRSTNNTVPPVLFDWWDLYFFSLLKDDFAKCQLAVFSQYSFFSQHLNILLCSFLCASFLRTVSCSFYLWSSIGKVCFPFGFFLD